MMTKITKYLSLGLLLLSFNATASDTPKIILALENADVRAMHAFDRLRTITADSLKKHGVNTIDYLGEDFQTVRLRKEDVKEDNPTLNKSLSDVLTGYTLFKNIEELYLELRSYTYDISALNGCKLFGKTRFHFNLKETKRNKQQNLSSEYSEKINMLNKVIFKKVSTGVKSFSLMNGILEGIWHLMTGKFGFHLQSPEAHAAQNTKFLSDLELAKILHQDKAAEIQTLIVSSDQTIALKSINELGCLIANLSAVLNYGIASNAKIIKNFDISPDEL